MNDDLIETLDNELTEEELEGDIPRAQNFEPDPQLSDCTPTTFDYSRSGYDRGHCFIIIFAVFKRVLTIK